MNWIVQHHAALTPTNVHAQTEVLARWRQDEPAHGIVIVAQTQTAGRGQHGRSFASPRGGLYLSAVLEDLPEHLRHHLALVAGVAAAAALNAALDVGVRLRWPNDLVLDGKKLGGILVESAASGVRFAAIIGIGLNVNTHPQEFPPDLRPRAISLRQHTGRLHPVTEIQSLILAGLTKTLDMIGIEGLPPVVEAARRLDSLLGHHVELRDGAETISGTAASIGPEGELLIQSETGLSAHRTGSIVALDREHLR